MGPIPEAFNLMSKAGRGASGRRAGAGGGAQHSALAGDRPHVHPGPARWPSPRTLLRPRTIRMSMGIGTRLRSGRKAAPGRGRGDGDSGSEGSGVAWEPEARASFPGAVDRRGRAGAAREEGDPRAAPAPQSPPAPLPRTAVEAEDRARPPGAAHRPAPPRPAPSGLPGRNPLGANAGPWRRRGRGGQRRAGAGPQASEAKQPNRSARGPRRATPAPRPQGGCSLGLGATASGVTSTRSCEWATDEGKATPLSNLLQSEVQRDGARKGGFQGDRRRSLGSTPPLP